MTSIAESELQSNGNSMLLDMLTRALSVPKDYNRGNREMLGMATTLTYKFLCHALTLRYLLSGTRVSLPCREFDFVDFASYNVVARSLVEAFLVFHYLFSMRVSDEEIEFRHIAYRLMGLQFIQGIVQFAGTNQGSRQIGAQTRPVDELVGRLESNRVFQGLPERQQGQVKKGQEWKWKADGKGKYTWRHIAQDAAFSRTLSEGLYRYLSDFSHSGIVGVAGCLPTHTDEQEALSHQTPRILNSVEAVSQSPFHERFDKSLYWWHSVPACAPMQ